MLQHYLSLGILGAPVADDPSGFDSYTTLQATIAAWLNRGDLTARIPDFIRLAEARLNRTLRDPGEIVSTVISIANGSGDLPEDFGQLVAFGSAGRRVNAVTPGDFGTYYPQNGDPRVYTVTGTTISTLPSLGSAIVPIVYYRGIQRLSTSNQSNWLLARAPDVYLYAALVQAEFYGWNDERLPLIKNALDEAIMELRIDGESRRWSPGMAPRLGRT